MLCLAVVGMVLPRVAIAAPPESPTVGAALEEGDLTTASELAREAREKDPTAENWHREGKILEDLGDYDGAKAAYQGELQALPKDASGPRRAVQEDLARVDRASRGTVPDEPESQHRTELDKQWAGSAPPPRKAKKQAKPDAPGAKPRDRIVKKWYFWVTIAAIVASAAAVTGIAIKAARDERRDALDRQRAPGGFALPTVIRF